MAEINEGVLKRVDRKFEAGRNHFIARGIMSTIAIERAAGSHAEVEDMRDETNQLIVRLLAQKGAEGEVYAVYQDISPDGYQTSPDTVRVISRDGKPTGVERSSSPHGYAQRATTDDIAP